MIEKNMKSRHIQKHATESEWLKANIFVPKQAEIIVYDVDETHPYERFKIGDGVTLLANLPFSNETIDLTGYATESYVDEAVANAFGASDLNFTDDGEGNVILSTKNPDKIKIEMTDDGSGNITLSTSY